MLKGNIRKMLMLGRRPIPVRFRRSLNLDDQGITLHDYIQTDGQTRFTALSLGDEFFVRYVPQSRYFQSQELGIQGWQAEPQHLTALNQGTQLERVTQLKDGKEHMTTTTNEQSTATVDHGVYDIAYYHGRQQKRQLIYRLQRRTDEVADALQNHTDGPLQTIIDVGTADSLMLESLRKRFATTRFVGIDMSFALLQARQIAEITKVQGNAQILPVHSGVGDAIIATAIIEHLPEPALMLRECARILRPGGLLIITTPDPFLEHISSLIGLLKDAGHHYTFTLDTLQTLIRENGFEVVEARKFMFSPIGFPAEKMIEKILITLHLDLVMANQFVVARRVA
jgi:ubiquinone/menaquinone biosynthesis C-methylase UbiE